jgi:CRP-like cAMP-binding protein
LGVDLRGLKDAAAKQMAHRRFDKAAEAYRELCRLEPNDPILRQRLGDALKGAHHPEEAVAAYQLAARRYAGEGQLLKAIAVNKVILEVAPGHSETQRHLASLFALRQGARGAPPPRAAVPAGPDVDVDLGPPDESEEAETELEISESAPIEASRLSRTPIFSDLPEDEFVALLEQAELREFGADEVILRQGEEGHSFFVLSDGTVRVVRETDTGERVKLARLKEGAFFGEMALVSRRARSATVEAEGAVQALEFSAVALEELMTRHPEIGAVLDRFIQNRLLSNAMATSALFRPFDRAHRVALIERFSVRSLEPGDVVIAEGTSSDGLYVVLEGTLEVRSGDLLVSELKEGDLFGEISLLTRGPATASVSAPGAARVLRLPKPIFDEVILTHPQVLELISDLASRRREALAPLLALPAEESDEDLVLV